MTTRRDVLLGAIAASALSRAEWAGAAPSQPSTPVNFAVPPGACDCHTHIHGDVEVLKQYGVPYEVLDPNGCVAAEPGLSTAAVPFVGALRLPNDDTGDCKLFTEQLASIASHVGVTFHYGTTIEGIETAGDRIRGVRTDRSISRPCEVSSR